MPKLDMQGSRISIDVDFSYDPRFSPWADRDPNKGLVRCGPFIWDYLVNDNDCGGVCYHQYTLPQELASALAEYAQHTPNVQRVTDVKPADKVLPDESKTIICPVRFDIIPTNRSSYFPPPTFEIREEIILPTGGCDLKTLCRIIKELQHYMGRTSSESLVYSEPVPWK